MKVDNNITEDEAALYDRQIRLWGVEAQKRLINSRVCLINVKGLACEIAKNLVLSGINSLTLIDENNVNEHDLKTNFLVERNSLGQNRAIASVNNLKNLNPMVKIQYETEKQTTKDNSYFNTINFDVVCALFYENLQDLKDLDELCRANNMLFISGYVFGIHGFMFNDLGKFKYICEAPEITEDQPPANPKEFKKPEKKLVLEEREKEFINYETFIQNYINVAKGLSGKKAKRLSKAYFYIILMRLFDDRYHAKLTEENKALMLELKKEFFDSNGVDQMLLEDSFVDELLSDSSAVNAILGGIIAQEIIKVITQKNEPIDNLFLFDGNQMSGVVEKIA